MPELSVDTTYKPHDTLEETMLPGEAHINTNIGMKMASKYIASQMLEEKHLKVLHKTLSTGWNRSSGRVQSLSAAISLMEQYGVKLTDDEVEHISSLEEERQIAALVNKMPQDTNEQFQQFFLQLQLLVSTAMRVRTGLEEGQPDKVAAALDDADSTGVSSQVLRMAVVQAGTEVSLQMAEYEAWVKDTDAKMAVLIRGQEDAMSAQKKLAGLQAQLQHGQDAHREKSAKVCMSFISGMTDALRIACFKGWYSAAKKAKAEATIAAEFEDQLEDIQRRFLEYREAQLSNVRGIFDKKGKLMASELQSELLQLWRQLVVARKEDEALKSEVADLEAKLAETQGVQKENVKRVMQRMSAQNDAALMETCFKGWVQDWEEIKRDGVRKSVLEESQNKIQEYLKGKSDSAKKVLELAGGSTDSGLLQQVFSGWKRAWEDAKKEAELEAVINDQNSKFAAFAQQNKAAGNSAMERARYYTEQMLLMQTFYNWRMDWQMEMTLHKYHSKIDAKRQQLVGVHQMFRSFAQQLESGLKGSQDSDRSFTSHKRRDRSKYDDGSVSLPDIHKPVTPGSGHRGKLQVDGPRTAWG
eukprot:gb/GFBE01053426.1/.p1 GENE.gb/GFBE01053426.1/~~gb/GFBE01053426.1/.p1  ORF type:complete len:584 (+),score=185.26 gb/GFBE01053426.1/:1-1752(+)